MANSQLYNVLSALNSTDNKIYSKLTGFIETYNSSQLSGDSSTIQITDKMISIVDNSIASSKLAADINAKIEGGASLTGLVAGDNITITSGANPTISVVATGTCTENDSGLINGGLLYSALSGKMNAPVISDGNGGIVSSDGFDTEIVDISIPEVLSDLSGTDTVLTGATGTNSISASIDGHDLTVTIANASISGIGAVQLTNSIVSSDQSNAATPKAVYDYLTEAMTSVHTHDNKFILDSITSSDIVSWENGSAVSSVVLTTASTPTTGYLKTYELKVNSEVYKIDIPKDQFLLTSEFIVSANNIAGITNGDPCIKLVFNVPNTDGNPSGKDDIYIPVKDLVDTYTAGANIKIEDNKISVTDVLPLSSIPTITKSTLSGDVQTSLKYADNWKLTSGYVVQTSGVLTSGNIVIGTGGKAVNVSSYSIGVTEATNFGAENKFATEVGAKAYMDDKISSYFKEISGTISGNIGVSSGGLINDYLIVGYDNSNIKSMYEVVQTVTSSSSSGQIATAKAVYDHDAYILNGTNGTTSGVEEWGGSSVGSLADVLAKINDLNSQIQ